MNLSGDGVLRLMLGACVLLGGSAAAQGKAPAGDACALLSTAQVRSVLGVPVENGQHILPDSLTSCGWAAPGGASIGGKKIVLSLMTARSFKVGKTPVKGVTMTVEAGVGDDAYFISMPPFGTALSVKKGEAYFQLRIAGFPSGQVRTLERALALRLLDRV